MKIGIFDPYLDTFTGGEKYILTAAECLSSIYHVSIFWDPSQEEQIKQEAKRKLGVNLRNVSFSPNIFSKDVSLVSRFLQSRMYDRILLLSDGSIPFVWPELFLHFQSPMEWVVNDSRKTKLKLVRTKEVICNSLFTKKHIDNRLGVISKVVYPPIDTERKVHSRKENMILNVGRFGINWAGSSYKKQDVMLEVFKNMVEKGLGEWKLAMITSVSQEQREHFEEFKKKVKRFPIEVIENPDNATLWDYYGKAKVYWHASGFGEDLEKYPDRAEHFGIATAEAMHAGAVPVVINAGGQPEIVEDGKSGFLWNTIDELMRFTQQLVSKHDTWKEMSEQAKIRVKIFGKERFCKELRHILNEKN